MKATIIKRIDVLQIALHPEDDLEREVLEMIENNKDGLNIIRGSVYEAQGGHWRVQLDEYHQDDLIIRFDKLKGE